jgi:PIN domain nuclease of toxin-antitoxin system
MKLLLDTHIWFWSLVEPARLADPVRRELQGRDTEAWLSPISVWELLVLAAKGRVTLDAAPDRWVREALARAPLKEAVLNHEVARESRSVRLPHDDPADRFIAATARVYDLTLVTADERLLHAEACKLLANR